MTSPVDGSVPVAQVRRIEDLARNAWPAAETRQLDGWQLRFTHGVTRRANSVWPNGGAAPAVSERMVAQQIRDVEAFYAARGVPPQFQICPAARPADLDAQLAARGYAAAAETAVQVTSMKTLLARTASAVGGVDGMDVMVAPGLNDDWYAAYCVSEEVTGVAVPVRRAILGRIAASTGYALLRVNDRPAALGLGVVEANHLGIFCMATQPDLRRRGLAGQVLQALAQWGAAAGAEHAYLQVMLQNEAAQALYAQAGFRTLYHYHYRRYDRSVTV
ncbi:MAG: GNAT family N-acetyltransferase [Caldilineaceae bacterium]|nr:GNAT family N-acetyltransferase [Caldilineaceae bacterium]